MVNQHLSRPPRLLLLVTSTRRRGGEVFGAQIAGGLAERGWAVELRALVRDPGPSIAAEPLVDRERATLKPFDLRVVSALRREVKRFKPDVVFANGGATLPVSVGALVPRRHGRLVYGSIGEPLYWARSARSKRRTGFLLRRCDLITAVSHPTRRQIVDGLGVPSDHVVVAPPGVAPEFGDIERRDKSGDGLRVLFLGSLSPEKGPLSALRAAALAAEHAAVHIRFVGDGPLIAELSRAAADQGIDTVEVVGAVSDVKPHLAWAEVLVMPSRSEGLPGVLLEAGAAGVPAVAFDVGGVSDVVTTGTTGILVAPDSMEAMAEAIVGLAGDPQRRAKMGGAVRELVLARFGLKASLDRYDYILRALREGRPIGDS